MTRRPGGWAEEAGQALCDTYDYRLAPAIALAFEQEHARALRVVKELERKAKQNADKLDPLTLSGYFRSIDHILAALQRGRT